MADGLAVMQQRRTATPDAAPTPGSLAPGMLSVEMSSVPRRMWCGVPSSVDPTQQVLLIPSAIDTGATAPSNPQVGTLWFDGSTLNIWDGTGWVVAGAPGTAVGPTPPPNPGEGDLWFNTDDDTLNVFDGTSWVQVSGGPTVVIQDTPPLNAQDGDLWWDSSPGSGQLFIWYDDGTSAQWVAASSVGGTGSATIEISDSEPTSPQSGTLWWATDVAKLFLWNGTQWIIVVNTPDGAGPTADPAALISADAGNIITEGSDDLLYAAASWPAQGVTDGSNAAPGDVGEYISFFFPQQPVAGNTNSLNLTLSTAQIPPGDWLVQWTVVVNVAPDGATGGARAAFSTQGTPPLGNNLQASLVPAAPGGTNATINSMPIRLNNTTTFNYEIYVSTFFSGVTNIWVSGQLQAWRMR